VAAEPREPVAWEALTPREQQIAAMAARGMSNREIAEALFLTLKAVEARLTGAYRKLGVEGRPGLAGAVPAGTAEAAL
jgi:DNA-binding NarL/FixJ family response regulator